jgi:hypothetical protein
VLQLHLPDARACSLWINPVPEPPAPEKTRVHLDLRLASASVDHLVSAGARLLTEPGRDPWWVMADPEGNEFCAFPPGAQTTNPGVFELVVDARDAIAQAEWWAAVAGGAALAEGNAAHVTGAAGFPWQYWVFDPVPEPKTVKNRMHWDVQLSDGTPEALVDAGATLLRSPDADIRWWVLADPEGNEFCTFPP